MSSRTSASGYHTRAMRLMTRAVDSVGRGRGLHFLSALPRFVFPRVLTRVSLQPDTVLCYPAYDSYWSFYLLTRRTYEPSLEKLFLRITDHRFTFIDCGANFGYWSAQLSGTAFGAHACIAIEASTSTFEILRLTAAANNDRFRCLHRAIGRAPGSLRFTEGGHHAGRHVIDGENESRASNTTHRSLLPKRVVGVEATSLSELANDLEPPFVVKLDVEGFEIEAIDGAAEISDRSVFIYEDHGADRRHESTNAVLDRGFTVHYPDESGGVTKIERMSQVDRIKAGTRSEQTGYNFIASLGDSDLVRAATRT